MANICKWLEYRALEGRLWARLEVFIGMDNMVMYNAVWKGYSTSQELTDIIWTMYVFADALELHDTPIPCEWNSNDSSGNQQPVVWRPRFSGDGRPGYLRIHAAASEWS